MIQTLFLESLPLLGLSGALLVAGLGLTWVYHPSRAAARAALGGLVLVGLLLAVSHLVVTTRERLTAICHTLAGFADTGNVAGIAGFLADDFVAADLDKAEFLDRVEARLKEFQIDAPVLAHFQVTEAADGQAVAVFDAACDVRSAGHDFAGRILSRWRLSFRAREGRWLLTRLEAIPALFSPVRDLQQLLP